MGLFEINDRRFLTENPRVAQAVSEGRIARLQGLSPEVDDQEIKYHPRDQWTIIMEQSSPACSHCQTALLCSVH